MVGIYVKEILHIQSRFAVKGNDVNVEYIDLNGNARFTSNINLKNAASGSANICDIDIVSRDTTLQLKVVQYLLAIVL